MLAVAHSLNLDWEKVIQAIRHFSGVEHRLEFVASIDGINYFNDSKSTNVDSLRVALESFTCPVVLIAGGQGKGDSYEALFPLMKERVSTLIAMGEEAPLLEGIFSTLLPVCRAASMEEALQKARGAAKEGFAVLLSPACASFDSYANYEERGRHFKACVKLFQSEDCGQEDK